MHGTNMKITTMNMPECLICSMKLDAIFLSILNIHFLFFNEKLCLVYINGGTRHCVKKILLKVQKLADSIDLGYLFCSRSLKLSGLSHYMGF